MKRFILSLFFPATIIGAAILAIGTNCGAASVPPVTAACDTSNSKFIQLYNTQSGTEFNTYQAKVFEYSFKSSVNGTLCSFGYQGVPAINGFAYYKIELLNASNSVLATGTYSFNSASRSYRTPSPSVAITANVDYKVRRTLIDNLGNVNNDVCWFKQIPAPFAPITVGTMTITGTATYTYGTGGALVNTSTNGILPCIDIVLQ
jgi:hypothetical protein